MKNKLCLYLILILTTVCLSSCYTSYYYLVRHAEKGTTPADDPNLTAAGQQRAIALCDSLRNKNIKKIFVSNFNRTRQTAQPSANLLGLTPIIYPATPVDSIVAKLRAVAAQNVLVVGHSNTIPQVIQTLTGTSVPAIQESDYDNFYIIKRVKDLNSNTFTLVRAGTYGAPN